MSYFVRTMHVAARWGQPERRPPDRCYCGAKAHATLADAYACKAAVFSRHGVTMFLEVVDSAGARQ